MFAAIAYPIQIDVEHRLDPFSSMEDFVTSPSRSRVRLTVEIVIGQGDERFFQEARKLLIMDEEAAAVAFAGGVPRPTEEPRTLPSHLRLEP